MEENHVSAVNSGQLQLQRPQDPLEICAVTSQATPTVQQTDNTGVEIGQKHWKHQQY